MTEPTFTAFRHGRIDWREFLSGAHHVNITVSTQFADLEFSVDLDGEDADGHREVWVTGSRSIDDTEVGDDGVLRIQRRPLDEGDVATDGADPAAALARWLIESIGRGDRTDGVPSWHRMLDPELWGLSGRISAADDPATSADVLRVLAGDASRMVRSSVATNPSAPADVLRTLAADPEPSIRHLVADHHGIGTTELAVLVMDGDPQVRDAAARRCVAGLVAQERMAQRDDLAGDDRFDVILLTAGPRPISVIKELRAITGADLRTATDLATQPGSRVASGEGHAVAVIIAERVSGAGATVEIVPAS